jgi:hypothetical protein
VWSEGAIQGVWFLAPRDLGFKPRANTLLF